MFHVKQHEDGMVQKHFGEGAYRFSAMTAPTLPPRPSAAAVGLVCVATAFITVVQVLALPVALAIAIGARLDFRGSDERAVGVIRAWLRMSKWPMMALREESESADE